MRRSTSSRPCGAGSASARRALERAAARSRRQAPRAFDHGLPAADQQFDRLQRAAQQDGGGDHDAGRGLAADDQPGAEAEGDHLQQLARHARQGAEPGAGVRQLLLRAGAARRSALPVGERRARHAHGDHALGVAQQRIGLPLRGARRGHRALGDAARVVYSVSMPSPNSSSAPSAAMPPSSGCMTRDDQQVDRHPGRVEQRHHAGTRQQLAQLRDVAQRVVVATSRRPRTAVELAGERRGREAVLDAPPGGGQRARTRGVHVVAEDQHHAVPAGPASPVSRCCRSRIRGRRPAACTARAPAAPG